MINVKEQSIISKRADGLECEDGLFVSDDFICVVDGVTSKGKWTWDGHTSGYYAKELIVAGMSKLPADATGEEAINFLNQCLADGYTPERREEALHNSNEKIQANLIIYSRKRKQIWSFGDCQCIINGKLFSHEKKIDIILSNMRSLYLELERICGKTEEELIAHDTGREFILPILEKASLLENTKSEYDIVNLNGFEIETDKLVKYYLLEGDEVVLASDGYPELKTTLKESERKLAEILDKDPLCYKNYLSTKGLKEGNASFDDRTYISFTV
ncbi:MAG: hypothetical protein MJ147_04425 [Clostridia bacterium]|nr:hypothetical protein [Clostridia bacterium]